MTFSLGLDADVRAVGDLVLLQLAALGVEDGDFAVALEGDEHVVAFLVLDGHGVEVAVLDGAGVDGAVVVLDQRAVATPPVWNVRMVSCVPGSPMDWAAMMPTARPSSTSWPVVMSTP